MKCLKRSMIQDSLGTLRMSKWALFPTPGQTSLRPVHNYLCAEAAASPMHTLQSGRTFSLKDMLSIYQPS